MDWKEELELLEQNKCWGEAIAFIEQAIVENPDDLELYVRSVYLLLNLLLEEDYSACNLEHDLIAGMLRQYFDASYEKFKDNAEYLFFVGYLIGLAEWYFGQETLDLSRQMLKRAMETEPQDCLYRWAYSFVTADEAANHLCKKLVSNEEKMKWLESKGSPGQYMIWVIKTSCEKYVIEPEGIRSLRR